MSVDEPVDVVLFMPAATFGEIHGEATRLGISDSALFTAVWRLARPRMDQTSPSSASSASSGSSGSSVSSSEVRLASQSAGAVYFSLASSVRDDALAFAQSKDRSMSWAFLKAWALVRAQVAAAKSGESLR